MGQDQLIRVGVLVAALPLLAALLIGRSRYRLSQVPVLPGCWSSIMCSN